MKGLVVALLMLALMQASIGSVAAQATLAKPALVVRNRQVDGITHLAFSSDGRLLVSSSTSTENDSGTNVWDAASLRMLRAFHIRFDQDFSVEHSVGGLSRDNRYLVAGPSVFRVSDGALLRAEKLQDYEFDADSYSTSPDGRYGVVTASHYGHMGERRAALVVDFQNPAAPMRTVEIGGGSRAWGASCFAPDGRTFFAGVPFTAYALADGRAVRTVPGAYTRVLACAPDGRTFITGNDPTLIADDELVDLRDTRDGHVIASFGRLALATVAAFGADGRTIAFAAVDKRDPYQVRLASGNGRPLRTLHVRLPAGSKEPTSDFPWVIEAIAVAPQANTLAIGDWKGTIAYVDATTGATRQAVLSRASATARAAIALSPNGHWMAGAIGGRSIVWDLVTGQPALRLTQPCTIAAFSLDSRRMACAGSDTIDVWDVTESSRLATVRPPPGGPGEKAAIDALAFDATGRRLFVTFVTTDGKQGTVHAAVFGLDSGAERRLDDRARGGTILGVPPDHATVAWLRVDGTIERYDFAADRSEAIGRIPAEVASFDAAHRGGPLRDDMYLHSDVFREAAISSDGRRLALGPSVFPVDPNVSVYDVQRGTRLWSRRFDLASVRGFSPDGASLYLEQVCGCKPLLVLPTEPAIPGAAPMFRPLFDDADQVAFSRDGRIAVTTSTDALRIWNVADNRLVGLLYDGSPDADDWLAVTPGGLFDGTLASTRDIVWRFNDDTFDYAPPEAFFNDFYEPGLLAELFAGTTPPERPLQQLDRRVPRVTLGVPASRSAVRRVPVAVAVDGEAAQRVDLFRNGTLVRSWDGAALGARMPLRLTTDVTIVAGKNRLQAYAINHDGVRSAVATAAIAGAPALARRGVAHVLAIGLDTYENPNLGLRYAAADARAFAAAIGRAAATVKRYASVDVVTLIDAQATKTAILAQLRAIGRRSAPEDAVYVAFDGHGLKRGDHYYLLPYDVGYRGPTVGMGRAGLEQLVAHGVSDLDLAEAFAGIDAAGIDLVIDACESGGIFGPNERLGSMNARGLARLAYDKGMYVLTAAQGDQAALESSRYGHGLLSYALVERGLVGRLAAPDAPVLYTRPWLSYAQSAVPALEAQMMDDAQRGGLRLAFVDGEERAIDDPADRDLQRPRLYLPARSGADDLVVAQYTGAK